MERLLTLLTEPGQDQTRPCHLITVVTSEAASAAADLLSSGDYALAYPGTSILYHGVRVSQERPLTADWTSLLVQYLRESDTTYATKLAHKIVDRFMFRFVTSKEHFDEIRQKSSEYMTDLDCFLSFVSGNLSLSAKRVVDSSKARFERYQELLEWVMKKAKSRGTKTDAEFEAVQIKAIVEFEVRANKAKKDWSFADGGIASLTDDFFLLDEYLGNYRSGFFRRLCLKYGHFLLEREANEDLDKLPEADRVIQKIEMASPLLLPIWSFFVAFCHALQHGENDLTATDAAWLGLIDEIIGDDELPCRRLAFEYTPDDEPSDEEEQTNGQEKAAETEESPRPA